MTYEPTWDLGRKRRLGRILHPDSGRAVVVAVDHGLFIGPLPGLESVPDTVASVVAGEPDAVQMTPGTALAAGRLLPARGAPSLILRLDATNLWRARPAAHPIYHACVASPMDAIRFGAEAAVCFLFVGYGDDTAERDNLEKLGEWAAECRGLGLPLIVEPLAIAPDGRPVRDPELVELLVRMAWEAGADLIKADYTGEVQTFERVIRSVPVPVLVRGGPRMDTLAETLHVVSETLKAGAAGVVFGRNIWQHPDPAGVVRAIRLLCHEGMSLTEVLENLPAGTR